MKRRGDDNNCKWIEIKKLELSLSVHENCILYRKFSNKKRSREITLQIIKGMFLAESITTRSNNLVMIANPKNQMERKKMTPYAKIGRVGGQTIRGWLRHAMEKILLDYGVSVCHPLPKNTITSDRNKEFYEDDLSLHYHPRGKCKKEGGCLIYNMFGDLDRFGNLIVQSIFFYPTTTGNGTATKNINKLFGSVGGGRLELSNQSPRARKYSHRTYMTTEHLVGVMIEAPLNMILREDNDDQKIVLLKTLLFLKDKVLNNDADYFMGGMRSSGYGRVAMLPLEPKKRKKKQSKLVEGDEDEEEPIRKRKYRIQFTMSKEEQKILEDKFLKVIKKQSKKFPIEKEEKSE